MKKLSFKEVAPERILDYEAMSHIKGGIDDGYDGYGTLGTCGMKYGNEFVICGVSKETIQRIHGLLDPTTPYWWCCDSCSSTTYCKDANNGGY